MAKEKKNICPPVETGANVVIQDNSTTKSAKVENTDNVNDTANVLDAEEFEPVSRKEFFKNLKLACGLEEFSKEEVAEQLAQDLATGKITGAEFFTKIAELRNESNSRNKQANDLSFEQVLSIMCDNSSEEEILVNVGTNDMNELKSKLADSNYIYIFHKEQSENENKQFAVFPVTISSAHKKYVVNTYREQVEENTLNVLRSLRSYSAYLSAYKKASKEKKSEDNVLSRFSQIVAQLENDFGYSKEEIKNMI